MEIKRIIVMVFFGVLGGYVGYSFDGIQGAFYMGLLGVLIGFFITTKSFIQSCQRAEKRRGEERDIRRKAYHNELGRQRAMGDFEDERKSKLAQREQFKNISRNAGYPA
jgi:hypothetical protein